jgi:hypothetical protein
VALGRQGRRDWDYHYIVWRFVFLGHQVDRLDERGADARAFSPEHFQLHWATVVEPDTLNGTPGSIYLWAVALDDNNLPAGTACDIDLPEGEPDHDRRLAGAPPRQHETGSPCDPTAFIQHTPRIEFEDMPPPALPT